MPYDRPPPPRGAGDPALRELLVFLRDTFRDAATRIDRFLGDGGRDRDAGFDRRNDRGFDRGVDRNNDRGFEPPRNDRGFDRNNDRGFEPPRNDRNDRGFEPRTAPNRPSDPGTHLPLESLRDEARRISTDAAQMDPAELRLRVEAVTAETRSLQNRAADPEDKDIAAKILRALTAIVSEHRPGHVYGLARHHQADWDDVGRRARQELANFPAGNGEPEGDE